MICIVCCRHAACVPTGSVSSARRPRLPCDLGCPNSSSRRFSCEASRGPSSGAPSIHLPCATNPSIHSVLWLASPATHSGHVPGHVPGYSQRPLAHVPGSSTHPLAVFSPPGPYALLASRPCAARFGSSHIRVAGPRASYPNRRAAGVISESKGRGRHIRVAGLRASYPSRMTAGVISESQGRGRHIRVTGLWASYPSHRAAGVWSGQRRDTQRSRSDLRPSHIRVRYRRRPRIASPSPAAERRRGPAARDPGPGRAGGGARWLSGAGAGRGGR